MKIYKIILSCFICMLMASTQAENVISEARIYVNPGHGGWGSNDRPMATINYAALDSLGFFETNTNLLKGMALRDDLLKAGAGYVRMSRTINGIYTPSNDWPNSSPNARYSEVLEGNGQLITLSVICEDAETNNMDYFISIHSNAASEGSSVNYPLLLYRGTDAEVGNGLTEAKNMALDAWKYIFPNDITYRSAYGLTKNNVRGDITFMNGSATTTIGDKSYTGYYGVLRHGVDGFLSEGCFHTYQPERQRLLNKDYCRQEGVRYSRAIRAWFGDNTETKGCIMGSVKDASRALEHVLYKYQVNSIDAFAPINHAEVVLNDSEGNEVGRYTTDGEHNGVYVFTGLLPGNYELVFKIENYWEATAEIEVKANETAFLNQKLTPTSMEKPKPEVNPEVKDFEHPVQDGDIAGASQYNFRKDAETEVAALAGLTVRRAILRNGKYYILAVDAQKAPKLFVVNPETGELIKEMSTEGIVTEGYNGKTYPYVLSDIAFTQDNVLIGTNSTIVGKESNAFQTGNFYVYKWQATGTVDLEDAKPEILLTLNTNTSASLAAAGNNNSNFMANSIALTGTINNFKLYFDSHPGNDWTTDYDVRYVCWQVEKGVLAGTQYNNINVSVLEGLGEDSQISLSPIALNRFIGDGHKIAPFELEMNWLTNDKIEKGTLADNIDLASKGANYFRYAKRIYMTTPALEKQTDENYSYKMNLYDITGGLDKALKIGETTADFTAPAGYMNAAATVDNANIDMYLLAGNKVLKYTTKEVEQPASPARVFAYNLKSEYKAETGYEISFNLNEDATMVELILNEPETGAEVKVISLGALSKGANKTTVAASDFPETGESYNWSVRAKANNVTRLTKLSDDSGKWNYVSPKSVTTDNSTESDYFGRVYITGTMDGGEKTKGIFVLGADDSDITSQGNAGYAGGLGWKGTAGQNFRKVAAAPDGRIFIADAGTTESGVYVMNPATFAITPLFKGQRNADGQINNGGSYVGGRTTAVGLRGTGENLRLYTVDISNPNGSAWKRMINTYDIGESATWDKAPSSSGAPSSYVGNENNSIVPVEAGYWAGQYRGAGSGNSAGTPSMFYYSDKFSNAVFNSASFTDPDEKQYSFDQSSQNGGLAVNEKEGLVVFSYQGGVQVFEYTMNDEGVPGVYPKFHHDLSVVGATYDDFAFDYAGNLYAVSYSKGIVSKWAMPTVDNTCLTPAKKSDLLLKGGISVIPGVSDLRATINSDEVTLTWTAPEYEKSAVKEYEIYRGSDLAGTVTETRYVDSDLRNGDYTYKVIVTYEDGSKGAEATTTATVATGLNEGRIISAVYPNPTNAYVTIESAARINDIQVIDLNGRLMFNSTGLDTYKETIDLSALSAGAYILKVNGDTVRVIRK